MSSPAESAAPRPFVDRPAGDRAGADTLAARVAALHGWPPPVLLRDAANAIYRGNDAVIRVSRPTQHAANAYALADWLGANQVRVPHPYAGRPLVVDAGDDGVEQAATVWEFVTPVAEVADWAEVGAMVRRLHGLDPAHVPAGYPVAACTSFPWWHFDTRLAEVEPHIDAAAHDGLARAVAEHGDWVARSESVDRWVLCHGDLHHHNVIAARDGPVIIDWDLLCLGPPGWDHAPLLAMVQHWGVDPALYDRFGAGYGADLRAEPATASLTVLRAVAATLLRVVAEGPERPPDSEASRRLRYWRGDPDAPIWTFV